MDEEMFVSCVPLIPLLIRSGCYFLRNVRAGFFAVFNLLVVISVVGTILAAYRSVVVVAVEVAIVGMAAETHLVVAECGVVSKRSVNLHRHPTDVDLWHLFNNNLSLDVVFLHRIGAIAMTNENELVSLWWSRKWRPLVHHKLPCH